VGDHFHQPDHRQAGGVHHGLDARAAHARTGATEEVRVRPDAAQLIHQQGGVEIAGRFAGRYQNVADHLRPV
jgi:hypothetical protein